MVTKYIGIDMTFFMCLMFAMPMMFFLAGLLHFHNTGPELSQPVLYGLSKGMFYANMFITLLYIGVKKF